MATIRKMLFPGCTSRLMGHVETWFGPGGGHTVDPTRNPGYNQHDPAFVAKHVAYFRSLGIQVLMFNTYPVGSFPNIALVLYMAECQKQGLNFCINIDKAIYSAQKQPIAAIQAYMTWLRANAFSNTAYERYEGKYLVTYFTMPTDNAAWFGQVEAQNPDCVFVYDNPAMGNNTMNWVQPDLAANLEWWVQTYGLKRSGLQIPGIAAGFNDTDSAVKVAAGAALESCWTGPARVWPPTATSACPAGPSAVTLQTYLNSFNGNYNASNEPAYVQLVTMNDWDEGTALEGKYDAATGTFSGGYFDPVEVDHGEVWIDGTKYGNFAVGDHQLTVVLAYTDGSLQRDNFPMNL